MCKSLREKIMKNNYVWYASYGSNLSFQRFICYIRGGRPFFGKKENCGCRDKNSPIESDPFIINFPLYFASSRNDNTSMMWGAGGVAFLDDSACGNTFGRIWKITNEQFESVKSQESPALYDKELLLDIHSDGLPIKTITSSKKIRNLKKPSPEYLKTMTRGLCQIYGFSDKILMKYIENIEGYNN